MATGINITNQNTQNLLLGGNRFDNGTYTNGSGSERTLAVGTLVGRVLATNKIAPCVSSNTDGSEMPIGVVVEAVTVADGASAVVTFCNYGMINELAVVLGGSDTMSTAVRTVSTGGGTIRDLIVRNTGLKLQESVEMSGYDNQ